MKQFPRRKLCEIVAQYGASLYDDPLRCEGLLSDLCGQYKREVFVLVCAVKQNVPADLLNFSGRVPVELIMVRISNRLRTDLSLNKSAARWATESWALALGLISAAELKKRTFKNRVLLPKNFRNPAGNDLSGAPNAEKTSKDSLNPTTARKDKETFFRRVGFMVLMMYLGFVVGWVLSRMG